MVSGRFSSNALRAGALGEVYLLAAARPDRWGAVGYARAHA
jgi:hypothetical protein